MLHITNGDSAAEIMRQAGIGGEILPWRDVLHEGPVPAGLSIEDLSRVRAQFIADCGWGPLDEIRQEFQARDAKLGTFRDHDEVILWFEHDLYDQLQLLQLLDYFSGRESGRTALNLICIDEYLGLLSPARMAALEPQKKRVTPQQLQLARIAWAAFRAPEPNGWHALVHLDTSPLPFLAGAVVRHLEQYPSVGNGLNRTESQLLEAVRGGNRNPGRIFAASQSAEERMFMGDSTFWLCMKAMCDSRPPLLTTGGGAPLALPCPDLPPEDFRRQEIALAEAGETILRNELDWIAMNGIDKWLGGVRLGTGRYWRWDGPGSRLVEAAQR